MIEQEKRNPQQADFKPGLKRKAESDKIKPQNPKRTLYYEEVKDTVMLILHRNNGVSSFSQIRNYLRFTFFAFLHFYIFKNSNIKNHFF